MKRHGIYFNNISTTMPASTTASKIVGYQNNFNVGIDQPDNNFVIEHAGSHLLFASLSAACASEPYLTAMLYVNGQNTGIQFGLLLKALPVNGGLFAVLHDLEIGDQIDLRLRVDSGTQTLTIYDAALAAVAL